MRRRLFLLSGTASALALAGCGGGGGGGADAGAAPSGGVASQVGAASAASSSLPEKILGCYYTTWDMGTYKVTDVPQEFNVIYLFHSKPGTGPISGSYNNNGDGSFWFEHFDEISADQIQMCRNRGQKVILTVGGANAGYAWDTRAKSQRFVESFKQMYTRFGGVDGIDFNNFEGTIVNSGNAAAVTTEMIWIASQLKGIYGQGFAVTSPPQPNDPLQQQMMAAMATAGVLDYAGPQFYDWSGFNEAGYIKGRMDTWVNLLGESKAVVGLSADYANGPSLNDCLRELKAVKAAHGGIRGAFCWSAQTQLAGGNKWAKAIKAML